MKKADLINKIAKDAGVTKRIAKEAVNSIINGISSALREGDKVTLVGFGTFDTFTRKARKGRDPRKGTIIRIPSRRVPRFRPSDELKKKVK